MTYTVNGDGGYVADVTYEGEAQYPEVNNSFCFSSKTDNFTTQVKPYAPPAPAYKPAAY